MNNPSSQPVGNVDLRYGLRSPRDLYEKVRRDAGRLRVEVTSDDFFNFVITAYSLADWIKNDLRLPDAVRTYPVASKSNGDQILLLCGEIANGSKHFALRKANPQARAITSSQGWGMGRYGRGAYGVGEESIVIAMADGTERHCLEFVDDVVAFWESFFTNDQIL